jgi:hypothetical protein
MVYLFFYFREEKWLVICLINLQFCKETFSSRKCLFFFIFSCIFDTTDAICPKDTAKNKKRKKEDFFLQK